MSGSSKTRENSLWKWLRDNTRHMRDDLYLQRIENIVGVGTPDVEGFLRDVGAFWIELKAVARTNPVHTGVDEDQVRWHRNRWRVGDRSWFLIQVGSGKSAKRYLVAGSKGLRLVNPIPESELEDMSYLDPSISAPNLLKMLGK